MIKPSKHMSLDSSVLRQAAILLSAFRDRGPLRLSEIEHLIQVSCGGAGRFNIHATLSFLFALKRIVYDDSSDLFILNNSNGLK